MVVDVVEEERYWYPADGGQVWLAGYVPVHADGRFVARDAPELSGRGLRTANVAGAAAHHGDVLASDAAAPGSPLALCRDAANPHDANAIVVETPAGVLGFVPRELAAELAPLLDAGEPFAAVVLRERRDSPRDPRTGVTMLLGPGERIELRVR